MIVGLEEVLTLTICLMINLSGPAVCYSGDLVQAALQRHKIPFLSLLLAFIY